MAASDKSNVLSRQMSTLGLVATVVAGTLGSGLFVTVGTASKTTGPSVILAIAITGIIAMSIAANYSWVATIFPGAGGAYTYISRSFNNRFFGFIITWSHWLGFMAADAVLAIGFGSYLQDFFPGVDPTIVGFILLTILFLINMVGVKGYQRTENIMFVLLLLSIAVLVIPGLFYIQPAHYTPFFTGGISGFIAAAVPLFYAYIGIEIAGQMGAEVHNPKRTLPLAMAGGAAILIFIYLLTAVVIYGVAEHYTVLANSDSPLSTAADLFLGKYAVGVVTIGGLLATATSVHAVMAAAIKIPYSWSWDHVFPRAFSHVNHRFGTPHWSLLLLYIVSVVLVFWSGGLEKALQIATFSYLLAYATVSLAAGFIFLRRHEIAQRAAFTPGLWFYFTVPIGLVGSAALISKSGDWYALFTGQFAQFTTFAIYIPWLIIGLVVSGIYIYLGRRQGDDIPAILNTLPGIAEEDRDT